MSRAARLTPGVRRRQDLLAGARWWGGAFVVTALGLVTAIASWVSGDRPGVVVMLLGLSLSCGASTLRLRDEFRRGWRRGYETAIRGILERASGRTSTAEVRTIVNGDPTPEPWHPHVSIRVERRNP